MVVSRFNVYPALGPTVSKTAKQRFLARIGVKIFAEPNAFLGYASAILQLDGQYKDEFVSAVRESAHRIAFLRRAIGRYAACSHDISGRKSPRTWRHERFEPR
jgi:hypothetical protein